MTVPLRPPIAYFGSKVRIAPRIVEYLPPHRGYVEPYCGSLAVLFAKPPSVYECVNDLDGDLVLFWRMLRDRLPDLERVCRLTPHAREEYADAWPITEDCDDLERARRVWVKLTQARGGSLRTTGWRYHEGVAGRSSSMPRTLQGYLGRFAPVAERLMGVSLENRPALEVIERYGRDPGQLLYVDPPYPFDVRGRRQESHGSCARRCCGATGLSRGRSGYGRSRHEVRTPTLRRRATVPVAARLRAGGLPRGTVRGAAVDLAPARRTR
jgi:DNA adenine methylase